MSDIVGDVTGTALPVSGLGAMTTPETTPAPNLSRLRVLVAIASFGEKNLDHLRAIIDVYRSMTFDVDIVVNSEAPKDLGAGVKVIVGFPASNPHSLPFAHRRVFAENLERYDLFIYTEDDIGVTEQSIHAFLRLTADLESDEIAGHLRYEVAKDGSVHLPDVHGAFHWRPESARRRGSHTVAEFTNEHAGFYVLTQSQLRRAIASGGYLLPPREGRYGMLETGATDPYTSCGFRKVLSISGLEEFLIHHMPNRYVGIMGIPLDAFKEQIATLTDILNGRHRAATLCEVEPKIFQRHWSKCYYEQPSDELLRALPKDAATTLSVASGWGATEIELTQRGSRVTALPLDSVIGASLARHNVEVVSGTLAECSASLSGRKFDCVLMSNLLHLLPDPLEVLRDFATFVRRGGTLVVTGYNFDYLPHLVRRGLGMGSYADLREFAQSGISLVGVASVKRELRRAGLRVELLHWFDDVPLPKRLPHHRQWGGRLANRNWIVKARQPD